MLFGIPKGQHDRLQRILNAAARNVCLVHTFSHHTPVLCNLHWLPVPYWIQFKILLLVHPALFGVAPVYLKKLLRKVVPTIQDLNEAANLRSSKQSTRPFGTGPSHVLAPDCRALSLQLSGVPGAFKVSSRL